MTMQVVEGVDWGRVPGYSVNTKPKNSHLPPAPASLYWDTQT